MKRIKKILCVLTSLLMIISMSACGDKQELSMTYEQPINTLAGSIMNYDEESYLNCFTPAAREKYVNDKEYDENFIESIYPPSSKEQKLSASIIEHLELDEKAIEELEKSYVRTFKRRVNISKAISLSVRFKLFQSELKRTALKKMIVIRVDNTWYIYGEVLDDLDFSINNAMFSDILKAAEDENEE
ncbi:MAG: hypothetical protein IJ740_11425 [Ruminococcus sp.]|nr:hypothetical protein [Ruminococcus sp.]